MQKDKEIKKYIIRKRKRNEKEKLKKQKQMI